jgi:hypothetical protein
MTDSRNGQTNLPGTTCHHRSKRIDGRLHRQVPNECVDFARNNDGINNQQPDHDASNAEAQQPRPIPLTSTERSRRLRAFKRQNQSNDADAQNRSVALSDTERKRRYREAKRKIVSISRTQHETKNK